MVTRDSGPSKEALERRTQQTHCRWPCGSPGAMRQCPSVSLFGLASSLVYVSEASKASYASSRETKNELIGCEGGTEEVMTGRVRLLRS